MSEKTPLIAPVTHASADSARHVQRGSKVRTVGKVLVIAAAAGLVFYGAPQGPLIVI